MLMWGVVKINFEGFKISTKKKNTIGLVVRDRQGVFSQVGAIGKENYIYNYGYREIEIKQYQLTMWFFGLKKRETIKL